MTEEQLRASGEDEARARAERVLQRLPPRMRHRVAWALSQWPGRIAIRSAAGSIRLGIFDRSMTVAAQFFTSVLPILILFASWTTARQTHELSKVVNLPAESRDALEQAVGGGGRSAFGVIGTLMVLVSATSLSRALTRAFANVWELEDLRSSIASAWRWLAAVLALALSLVAVRALVTAANHVPPPGVWRLVVTLCCDLAIAAFVPWVLLQGRVHWRPLVPGALLYAVVMMVMRPAAGVWLPRALDTSAERYGPIGVAFTYLAWLYVVAFAFLGAAVLGRAISVDPGALGRWIRGEPRLIRNV
jgi:membrane protein